MDKELFWDAVYVGMFGAMQDAISEPFGAPPWPGQCGPQIKLPVAASPLTITSQE